MTEFSRRSLYSRNFRCDITPLERPPSPATCSGAQLRLSRQPPARRKLALCRTLLAVVDAAARRSATAKSDSASPTERLMSVRAAAGMWNRSVRSCARCRRTPRPGTTAHDRGWFARGCVRQRNDERSALACPEELDSQRQVGRNDCRTERRTETRGARRLRSRQHARPRSGAAARRSRRGRLHASL